MRLFPHIIIFALVFFVPIPQFAFGASSFTTGLYIVIIIFLLFYSVKNSFHIAKITFNIITGLIVFMILHLYVATIILPEINFVRGITSIALFMIMIFSAYFLSNVLIRLKEDDINQIINSILIFFVFSFLCYFIPFFQRSGLTKSIFPFNEPSHFALYALPFIYFKILTLRKPMFVFLMMLIIITVSILLKNLTILLGCAFIFLLYYRLKSAILLPFVFYFLLYYVDVSYFAERLNFSKQTTNTSVLVFIQGWELAIESLRKTNGWGIGFQQLGFVDMHSNARDVIYRLIGQDMNVTDAGLTAPKIISEFGVFGIIGIALYLWKSFFLVLKLPKIRDKRFLLAVSFYLSFLIDLFVRGIGYFNTPFLFFLTSLFMIRYLQQVKESK